MERTKKRMATPIKSFIPAEEMDSLVKKGDASIPDFISAEDADKFFGTNERSDKMSAFPNVGGVAKGFAKGVGSLFTGTARLGQKIANVGERALGLKETQLAGYDRAQEALTPKGTAEKIGYGAEQIAEFLIPSSKLARVGKAVESGSKLLRAPQFAQKLSSIAGRSALEASAAGGQQLLHDNADDAKTAALVAAAFPVIGAGLSVGKSVLRAVGEKVQDTVLRATAKDIADGFSVANLRKYDVGGSLSETVAKTHTKLNQLSSKLRSVLRNSDTVVNLNQAIESTEKLLASKKGSTFGDNAGISRVLASLKEEVSGVAGPNGLVDLVEATNVKRGAGTKGAWAYGRPDPDAGAVETVYTNFYNVLKRQIEKAADRTLQAGRVKALNKAISELIPISNAALRRLPIEQRNNILSFTDNLGLFSAVFDPSALALIGANRLSKSGKFGNFLVKSAEELKNRGSVGKRFLGSP